MSVSRQISVREYENKQKKKVVIKSIIYSTPFRSSRFKIHS